MEKGKKLGIKVKICGLKREKDIEIVNKYCPDYIGFVLAPSKRQISLEQAKALKTSLNPEIKVVGVFVNPTLEELEQFAEANAVDVIQLHGDEDLERIIEIKNKIGLPIIKALRIRNKQSLLEAEKIIASKAVDQLLFDTYSSRGYGGLGECFDWQMLKAVSRAYFLAGGINLENIDEALRNTNYGVDISSGVETDGVKDEEKVRDIIKKIRMYSEQDN